MKDFNKFKEEIKKEFEEEVSTEDELMSWLKRVELTLIKNQVMYEIIPELNKILEEKK